MITVNLGWRYFNYLEITTDTLLLYSKVALSSFDVQDVAYLAGGRTNTLIPALQQDVAFLVPTPFCKVTGQGMHRQQYIGRKK